MIRWAFVILLLLATSASANLVQMVTISGGGMPIAPACGGTVIAGAGALIIGSNTNIVVIMGCAS